MKKNHVATKHTVTLPPHDISFMPLTPKTSIKYTNTLMEMEEILSSQLSCQTSPLYQPYRNLTIEQLTNSWQSYGIQVVTP